MGERPGLQIGTAADRDSSPNIATAALASIAGWLLFAVGVVSPLTPSEGYPGPLTLAIFLGAPALLFGWLGMKATTRFVRVAGLVQLFVLGWFAWAVLSMVFGA
jgi:hypothetical protein